MSTLQEQQKQATPTTLCCFLCSQLGKLDHPSQPMMMGSTDETDDGCSPDRTPVSSLDGPFLLGSLQQSLYYPGSLPSAMGGYAPAHTASFC